MKRKNAFQCTIMRGGTSKGIFVMEEELPRDPGLRDRIILAVFGSPDIRQIDGLGGADSLTSKLAIISPSKGPGRDIDYTFGAVGIDKPFIDYSANCGNISSAVGPYAIDKGLVRPEEPFTTVKIFNTNTKKMIHAKVPVKGKKVVSEGDYRIDGVPGAGAKIELSFLDPGGTATGRLLPTGNVTDEMILDTGERFFVTIVDAGNPTAFIAAQDLGLKGTERPEDLEQNPGVKMKLEAIRKKVGDIIGIRSSPSIPKIVFVESPEEIKTSTGKGIGEEGVDILARAMAMGKMHKAFPVTAGIPAAAAVVIPGSVVQKKSVPYRDDMLVRKVTIGHPSGRVEIEVEARQRAGLLEILCCTIGRTARKIMDGRVYIPKKVYSSVD